jgi:hypothetical protein
VTRVLGDAWVAAFDASRRRDRGRPVGGHRLGWADARAFLAGAWEPTTARRAHRAQVLGDLGVLIATVDVLGAVRPQLSALVAGTEG